MHLGLEEGLPGPVTSQDQLGMAASMIQVGFAFPWATYLTEHTFDDPELAMIESKDNRRSNKFACPYAVLGADTH